MPSQKREELFFLIAKVNTLFVPDELHKFPGHHVVRGAVGRSEQYAGCPLVHEPLPPPVADAGHVRFARSGRQITP